MESNTGTGPAGEEQDVRETAFCVGDTSTYATLVDGACVCLWVCVFCLEGFCVHSIKKDEKVIFNLSAGNVGDMPSIMYF